MNRMAALFIVCTLLAPLAVSHAAEPAGKNSPDSPPASAPAATARARSFDDRHRSITFSGKEWTTFNPGAGWHSGTAKSSTAAGDFFEYAGANCTRLKWYSTKSNSRGRAAVYVDGELQATVDTFNPTTQTTAAVFDSGELPHGRHALKVVVLRQKSDSASDYWVECDKVEVTTTETWPTATALPSPDPLPRAVITNDSDGAVLCFGQWDPETDQDGFHDRDYRASNVQFNACEFRFRGTALRWFGSKNRDHGFADVYLDGVLQKTVDSYHATWISNVVLFEKTGLDAGPVHTLRIVVRKQRNSSATDCYQDVDCFEAAQPVNYVAKITQAMQAEYAQIGNNAKPYALPDTWKPVAYAAQSPNTGVSLQAGVFREALQRNIDYLNHCFASKTYCDGKGWWEWLPASNEGRLLQGAANALRWGERADMRNIVDTVVARIKARQRADGYHDYYPEKDSFALEAGGNSERKNYDRVFWTRGLLDAGRAGNADAYAIVRKFYDWFNACSYAPSVRMTVSCANPVTMNIRIRVPSWATDKVDIVVNGERATTGTPGSYASVRRTWANNDAIEFTLPMGFTTVQYTGLDQAAGNVDRYALLRGPILMALNDAEGRIHADAANLPSLLIPMEDGPLQYEVKGTSYRFAPYWQVKGSFTCFPMIQQPHK